MSIGHVLYVARGVAMPRDIKSLLESLDCTFRKTENIRIAKQLSNNESFDLIILQIEQKDRIEILEFLTNIKEETPFIFLAFEANESLYEEVKQANLVAYMVSPVDMLTLRSIIEYSLRNQMQTLLSSQRDWKTNTFFEETLFIKVNQLLQKVKIHDITHVRSEGNYCLIFTYEKKYAIKLSMVRLNQMLANNGFLQVHKSYLTQLNKIDNIDVSGNEVIIGELRIPLGRKYKQELLKHLNLL